MRKKFMTDKSFSINNDINDSIFSKIRANAKFNHRDGTETG